MINRTQKAIMSAIYKRAADKGGTCLIRPVELLSAIPYSVRFKRDDLPAYLKSLQTDDYFELIETDKKGETLLFHPSPKRLCGDKADQE